MKWSGLYFLAAFGLYVVGTDLLLRRRAGIRFWWAAGLLKQAPVLFLHLVPVAALTYLASWTGWFATRGGYDRTYVEDGGDRFTGLLAWVPVPLQNLWHWHTSIYAFHVGLSTDHDYEAPALLWPIIARPTSMYWQGSETGERSCDFGNCAEAFLAIPNPLIWYAGMAASVYLLVRFVRRREWQAGLVLMGFVAAYLPWLAFPNRTIFFFYSIAFEPYLILCLAATIGLLLLRPALADSDDGLVAAEVRHRLAVRRTLVGVFLGLTVLLSAFFYPLDTALQTPHWFWQIHMWSPTWI